ncbi:MAG: polymer-forming cytoskeletal protein [Acidobacteriota bacterium]
MANEGETTFIGRGIKVTGEITGQASIEILGELEGTAGTEGVFRVREGGKVNGEVAAKNVVLEGQVRGQIQAEEKADLRATCEIHGDLNAKAVSIADGAFFEGSIRMKKRN